MVVLHPEDVEKLADEVGIPDLAVVPGGVDHPDLVVVPGELGRRPGLEAGNHDLLVVGDPGLEVGSPGFGADTFGLEVGRSDLATDIPGLEVAPGQGHRPEGQVDCACKPERLCRGGPY